MNQKFTERGMLDLSQVNKDVLGEWLQESLFERSIKEREGAPSFVFYEGPPSANGMPGIHHVMARTIKDSFCRYKTMCGYKVNRKAGWDTHGLPVELGVEKSLNITKEDIGTKISVDDYNRQCRLEVMKYKEKWSDLTRKIGYWVDLEDPYITYDNRYIESLWWLLKELYKKGYLYKGYTIQPYSPAAGTGLSSHELNQPGCYRDVKDTTVTAQFRIVNPKQEWTKWGNAYFLAWTTTPWTLPSNTALCVGKKIEYVAVETYNPYSAEKECVILAKNRLGAYFSADGANADMEAYQKGDKVVPYRVIAEYTGADLLDIKYEQLFPWVKPVDMQGKGQFKVSDKGFRVIHGDYVTTEDGTGIVHIAPTFGADDAFVAKAAGIPSLYMVTKKGEPRPMVDFTGKYWLQKDLDQAFLNECVKTDAYAEYEGAYVKNAYNPKYTVNGKYDADAAQKDEDLNIYICLKMKQDGSAFKIEKHVHNYPHCWRTDKPVIYYPLDSWFIKASSAKERMSELNRTIKWKPESTGTGRFGKWLENLNDWNLSRSRYWGTPLPIWRNDDGEEICIGSVEELYNEIEKSVAAGVMKANPFKEKDFVPGDYSAANYDKIDLHRPYVDYIVLVSASGKELKRETDLIDVWFDSGAMPFAQMHYPFENKDIIDNGTVYPADFIAEGVDQTRGWFYTLHAISTMIKDSVAYKAVISNGLVLDKNGNKMSKRLGNAVEPFQAIEQYGSDALRWYMITNAQPWDNLKFDTEGVTECVRKFFGTLHNTYKFFAQYANVDGFTSLEAPVKQSDLQVIDRWILSELNTLVKGVSESLDDYEPTRAGRLIQDFVNDYLSNWYVHLTRERYWGNGLSTDKLAAYQTLYKCLETVALLMAPIAPFYADRLYRDLHVNIDGGKKSVHLALYPKYDKDMVDKELETRMELAQKITSMVLALRKRDDVKINVRKPLQKILIPADAVLRSHLEPVSELIRGEVNVKEIEFAGEGDNGILVKKVKCNFKLLGKRFGALMKGVAAAVQNMSQKDIAQLQENGEFTFNIDGVEAVVNTTEVEIFSQDIPGWVVSNDGVLTVALDIQLTPELEREGLARELKKRIQDMRKQKGLEITDRINVEIGADSKIEEVLGEWSEWISRQVLADRLTILPVEKMAGVESVTIDEISVLINIEKN
ncbi:MAG: isoleucine--tRNA ligase [Bacteroidaceae bacterium]|nr:isoleucine--tRNA ligase [Bacteroidaceae bacterium]